MGAVSHHREIECVEGAVLADAVGSGKDVAVVVRFLNQTLTF